VKKLHRRVERLEGLGRVAAARLGERSLEALSDEELDARLDELQAKLYPSHPLSGKPSRERTMEEVMDEMRRGEEELAAEESDKGAH
jgi:hypothetical protein